MKQLFLAAVVSLLSAAASATIYTVQVENFKFTPAVLSIRVGDTVKWTWVNGSHTTTSTVIPAGALSWDAPMESANPTFSYKATVAGTYNYECTPHSAMMKGTIIVQSAAGISTQGADAHFRMYPNPAADNLRLELDDARQQVSVTIADALGRTIHSGSYSGNKTIDIATTAFANGIYSIRAIIAGKEYAQSFEVAH